MKRRSHLSPAQRRATAKRTAAYRAERLRDALRAAGLNIRGTPPVLCDGHLTPPEELARRYPRLAARLSELAVAQ